jgi:hypothetical protein
LFPAFTAVATSTSVFDLLPKVLPLPFNTIIPAISPKRDQDRKVSFHDTLADHMDSDSIDSPLTPLPVSHYDGQQPARARAFQSPFKLSASCTSTREASDKKVGSDGNKKKKREDKLFC